MKRKKEKSDNIWDKICSKMWYVLLGLVLIVFTLIILSKKGYCATNNANSLPYYVDYYKSAYFSDNFVVSGVNFDNYDMVWFSESYTSFGDKQMYMYYMPTNYSITLKNHDLNNNVDYSSFDFTSDYAVISNTNNNRIYRITLKLNNQGVWVNMNVSTSYTQSTVALLGRSSANINQYGYTPMIPYYLKEGVVLTDTANNIVFTNGTPVPPIDYGHATPPDEFNSPVYTQGHSKPEHVPPTITVNNYSWTTYTPPGIDDSGIIEILKSEIQVINYLAGWLKDNLQGMMTNLVNNIKSLFDYLVETIQYYGNLIISNIQNLITTFYNNMVSLVEDITDKLTYIVSPLDTIALQTAIQNTGIYNDYDRIFDMVGDAFGFYNDITEPNTFTIPIDLRNVTILHQTQIVYIDLGWLNSCKTIIRAFMWCVLTFGLLYTIIDSIPDYLQGNDE